MRNLLVIFLVTMLPLSLIGTCMFFCFKQLFLEQVIQTELDTVKRIRDVTDTVQSNMYTVCTNLANDAWIIEFAKSKKWDIPEYEVVHNINRIARTTSLPADDYIKSIYVYSNNNQYMISEQGAVPIERFWDKSCIDQYNDMQKIQPIANMFIAGRSMKAWMEEKPFSTITIYNGVESDSQQLMGEAFGFVAVNMDNTWIKELIQRGNNTTEDFYIVNGEGVILYNHRQEILNCIFQEITSFKLLGFRQNTKIYRENNIIKSISIIKSPITDCWYILISTLEEYQNKLQLLVTAIVLLLVLSFILLFLVAYKVSSYVFLPVKKIVEMVDNPKAFYDAYSLSDKKKEHPNELVYVVSTFLNSYTQNEKIEQQLAEYITNLKLSQARLLQAQINPHFLNNTLQTINFLAISLTKSDNAVSDSIHKLSRLARKMVEVDSAITILADEIEYCQIYLSIQQLRYRDEFDVIWNIPDYLQKCTIIKMTLQPILENCICHAFCSNNTRGQIIISGCDCRDTIELSVADNGIGQPEAWIRDKNLELAGKYNITGSHIGIGNINYRIKLLFGEDFGIQISSNTPSGLIVKISIPKERNA